MNKAGKLAHFRGLRFGGDLPDLECAPRQEADRHPAMCQRGQHMDYISDVAMTPFASDAVYVNLLAEDEPGRIPSAYGTNLDRLKELKRKWDPHNRFHGNQNIAP